MTPKAKKIDGCREMCHNRRMMNGTRLREIRVVNRLNQEAFGKIVGAGRQAVSDWERGRNAIPDNVGVIAYLIGKYPHLLLEIEILRGLREPPF